MILFRDSPLPPYRGGRGAASVPDEGVDRDPRVGLADALETPPRKESSITAPNPTTSPLSSLDEVDGAHRGGPGGDEVVDDEDALAGATPSSCISKMLDGVFVGGHDAGGLARQLALLADDGQAEPELPGQGRGEEEAARFDAGDELRPLAGRAQAASSSMA